MAQRQPAKLLRVHLDEDDRLQGKPLYETIVDACRRMGIAGATVFRALEGYGESTSLHRKPVVIAIVDTPERIATLEPEIARLIDTGLIAVSDVEVVRVQKGVII